MADPPTGPVPTAAVHSIEAAARVAQFAPRAMPPARARERAFWLSAVAASLAVGVILAPWVWAPQTGQQIAFEESRLVARGPLDRALDTQLASTQSTDAPVRIGVSFYDGERRLCRTFERAEFSGIACSDGHVWQLERLYGGNGRTRGDYRQANSGAPLALRDAQEMIAGSPLDAAGEATALSAARTR
ncbi:anti-sigma factor family protein [Sphingomonas sp. CJ99]